MTGGIVPAGVPPRVPSIPSRAELERRGVKIVIAVPPPPQIMADPFFYFWRIAQSGYPIMPLGPGAAETHRNHIGLNLLRDPQYKDFTHVLMLDADQLHPPDIAGRLGRWIVQDPSRRVIAGLYFKRGGTNEPLFRTYSADGNFRKPITWEEKTLFRVGTAGTGIMLVSRRVFERLKFPWFDYVYNDPETWRPGQELADYSEDTYFCLKCHEANIPVYLDPTAQSPHLMHKLVTAGDFYEKLQTRPDLLGPGKIVKRDVSYV